jgi:hypothetical protein
MDSNAKVDAECNKIRAFLSDGKHRHHKDIIDALGIPPATYYRRLRKIDVEDKVTSVELAKRSVEERTQRIKDALDSVSTINYEIMTDKKQPGRDRTGASTAFLSAEYWRWRVEQLGPNLPQLKEFTDKDGRQGSES